ncbi:hypothetical protein MAR_016435 [Mya arenaria]|uniref:Rrn7/TAF1B C-terminal cyclin domain-containing protein n=1 Tax=Mya arenaria TaxID=6604 RepID=A0ABY7FP03_MYAAR|nr:hypothetical protein MAR_016435 [Mya arenaria]
MIILKDMRVMVADDDDMEVSQARKLHEKHDRDREALQETLIDEEFDDGENPVELKGNVESDLDWSSGDEDVEEKEWGRYRRKLHNRDVHKGTIPSSENLRLDTGRLAVFLNLANIPNYPLILLLHKYILQLDLPAEIHGYAANILHATFPTTAYELNEKRKKLPFWEGMAMASIILTLKLFLGVNDSTERHGRVEDDTVDALIHRVEAIQYSDTHGRLYKRDVRESLKQPFTELAERWAQTDSGSHRNQPSNKINTDHSDTKNDPSLVFSSSWVSKVSREKRMEKLGEKIEEDATHLKHSTIEHLVNPECFTSSLNNPDTSVDPFINDFDESFESPEKRPKTYDGGNAFTMMTEKTKCEAILARLTDLKDKLASSANTCVTQSVSYNWLLGVCSELIENFKDVAFINMKNTTITPGREKLIIAHKYQKSVEKQHVLNIKLLLYTEVNTYSSLSVEIINFDMIWFGNYKCSSRYKNNADLYSTKYNLI